jgi:hypothetical protein
MRPHHAQRRLLPLLVLANSLGVVILAGLLVFAFQTRGAQFEQVQAERQRNVFTNCQDINRRHHHTIAQLDAGIRATIRLHPERARRLRESRKFTVLLIQALVPERDCEALARRQVSRPK